MQRGLHYEEWFEYPGGWQGGNRTKRMQKRSFRDWKERESDEDNLACGQEGVYSPSNQEREHLLIELCIREVVGLDQQRQNIEVLLSLFFDCVPLVLD